MIKRVLCAWFPQWPIQRRIVLQPELSDVPFVLFVESSRGLSVTDCSAAARERGIRPGMPLAEARGLCARSELSRTSSTGKFSAETSSSGTGASGTGSAVASGRTLGANSSAASTSSGSFGLSGSFSLSAPLLVEPSNPQADRTALQELALLCQAYCPVAGVEELEPPESLLLDITGCESHFGGEAALARLLENDFASYPYQARIAVADTIGAAWAVSHFRASSQSPVIVVPSGHQMDALRSLPISGLRLKSSIVETLHKLDLREIGQLENLPRTTLPARFGKDLLQRLDQARGTAMELMTPVTFQETIAVAWRSEEAYSSRETLELIVQGLLDQILVRLQPLRLGIQELQGRFAGAGVAVALNLRLLQPSADRKHLWELLRLEWERQERILQSSRDASLPELGGCLESIRLEVVVAAPLRVRQQTLFDLDPEKRQTQAFRQLVERLTSRLGTESVLQPQPVADPQPEYACHYTAWSDSVSDAASASLSTESQTWDASVSRSRPLQLLKNPESLRVLAGVSDGPPQRIVWGNLQLRIVQAWGPERIETGWWREHDVQRDYYRVETEQGHHLWIFRCRQTGCWFLHGLYG